jgi:desulfoferrodoxin (superoxide reductase-like protein)
MARPPQFERPEDFTRDVTAVKAAIKHLKPNDRAHLIAWMLLYYRDDGARFSPQIGRRREYYAQWYGVLARARAPLNERLQRCGYQSAD